MEKMVRMVAVVEDGVSWWKLVAMVTMVAMVEAVEAGGNGGGERMKQQRCYLHCCGQEIRADRLVGSSQTVLLNHCRQKLLSFQNADDK